MRRERILQKLTDACGGRCQLKMAKMGICSRCTREVGGYSGNSVLSYRSVFWRRDRGEAWKQGQKYLKKAMINPAILRRPIEQPRLFIV